MLYLNPKYNLTIQEMEQALRKSCLPIDADLWTDEQMEHVEWALAVAQMDKIKQIYNPYPEFLYKKRGRRQKYESITSAMDVVGWL